MDGDSRTPADMKLVDFILHSLDKDNAQDTVSIDLDGKSDMADFMVITSGRSTRQVISMSEKLLEKLKHERGLSASVEGKGQGDWVLIDAGDVIVHIFRPEVREFYQLEKLWMVALPETASR
ncbi:MAG: ribosome silencing factor [Rhodobacteraceae bacterium]|nr:ribosome silencing factor [Paracoccaceae bacterium]MCY4197781.1 ribosome silencing factor [Paracoccaceae bacterium]